VIFSYFVCKEKDCSSLHVFGIIFILSFSQTDLLLFLYTENGIGLNPAGDSCMSNDG
jgi:hypothetical protein